MAYWRHWHDIYLKVPRETLKKTTVKKVGVPNKIQSYSLPNTIPEQHC
jgi:hypothetical protein